MQRLAEVPGLGVDSAQQIIAEVGVTAATFPSPKHLASWMGACTGTEESAGKNYSHRCLNGNRQMAEAESTPHGRMIEALRERHPPIDDVAAATSRRSAFENDSANDALEDDWDNERQLIEPQQKT